MKSRFTLTLFASIALHASAILALSFCIHPIDLGLEREPANNSIDTAPLTIVMHEASEPQPAAPSALEQLTPAAPQEFAIPVAELPNLDVPPPPPVKAVLQDLPVSVKIAPVEIAEADSSIDLSSRDFTAKFRSRAPATSGGGGGGGNGVAFAQGTGGNGTGSGTGVGSGAGTGSGSGYGSGTGNGIGSGAGEGVGVAHGGGFRPPRPKQVFRGEYPAAGLRSRQEGTVVLLLSIGTDGRPQRVSVDRSSGYAELDRAACDTAAQWTFYPAEQDGRQVSYEVRAPYIFRLLN